MSLSPADVRSLKDAWKEAVKNHPSPDQPVASMGGPFLSMRQLADEVENETKIGKKVLNVYDEVIADGSTTLKHIIAQLKQKPAQP